MLDDIGLNSGFSSYKLTVLERCFSFYVFQASSFFKFINPQIEIIPNLDTLKMVWDLNAWMVQLLRAMPVSF